MTRKGPSLMTSLKKAGLINKYRVETCTGRVVYKGNNKADAINQAKRILEEENLDSLTVYQDGTPVRTIYAKSKQSSNKSSSVDYQPSSIQESDNNIIYKFIVISVIILIVIIKGC